MPRKNSTESENPPPIHEENPAEAAQTPEEAAATGLPSMADRPQEPPESPVEPGPEAPRPDNSPIESSEAAGELSPEMDTSTLPEAETVTEHTREDHPVETHAETLDEHHEDERRGSFAAKALTFLVVLIAGAALGIWGAPKLAPMLPSGLAPVAAWLTPGQSDAEAEVAALRADLDTRLEALSAEIPAPPDTAALEESLAARIAEAEAATQAELDRLADLIAASDGGDNRERLDRLQAAIDGQVAELGALKDQLATATLGEGEAAEAAIAQIDVYRAELEGLRAEFADVGAQVSRLGQRLDEVAASAERRVAEAEAQVADAQAQVAAVEEEAAAAMTGVEAQADLALIRAALSGGQPYAEPLDRLAAQPGVTVPDGLAAPADAGVATLSTLRAGFGDAAHEAIRASIVASAGEGIGARMQAFAQAQIASRSLTPQPGLTPDAVLSRMEDALRRDDLDTVLAEAASLPSEAAAAMAAWLDAARLRAGAVDGYEALAADLSAMN